ncbi:hypothetical protein PWY36_19530 [Kribbella solani]|nr:hypothetical protein [Kribbella solani]MDX2971378.1 hypothetical protein [Kribbella solani]
MPGRTYRQKRGFGRSTYRVHHWNVGTPTNRHHRAVHHLASEALRQITLLVLPYNHKHPPRTQLFSTDQSNLSPSNLRNPLAAHPHPSRRQSLQLLGRELVPIGAQHHVVAPSAQQQRPRN